MTGHAPNKNSNVIGITTIDVRTGSTPDPDTMRNTIDTARAGTREIAMAGMAPKRGITVTIGLRDNTIATMTNAVGHMHATTGTAATTIGMFRPTA
jgi:hypothetical protein